MLPLLGRFLRFSRPRTAAQLLALVFTVLAVLTGCALTIASVRTGHSPGLEAVWCGLLLLAAGFARIEPWWRERLVTFTWANTRIYSGIVALCFAAGSICWRIVAGEAGASQQYPLPGTLGTGWAGLATTLVVAGVGAGLLTRLPVRAAALDAVRRLNRVRTRWQTEEVVHSTEIPVSGFFEEIPEEEVVVAQEHADGNALDARTAAAPPPAAVAAPESKPAIDVFTTAPKSRGTPLDVEQISQRIEETLRSFNVGARVVGHHIGPVVTQFDIEPNRGVKVRRITELHNDLALALSAPSIRIQAPVPGKPFVGIEIPNASASVVGLRDLLETDSYRSMTSPLRVALGKDVAGSGVVIDLAKMPHLLIAGATGSGKSVCVNAIISCLLYQNTPEQVRLMMVDPKMVELAVYNGVPHLLSPVVTQMDKVVGVLQWAIREMERRYQLFADSAVRNIGRYNEKFAEEGKRLPYIVLIVDELADLMLVSPEEVEDSVCRLAQLARAAGIHLVLATQRPSVDVVTGLIKANFPARIAFAMTSQVDSRTILDAVGAEKLLGRGDMLYLPPDAAKPMRLQGANVTDKEVERLVEFWRRAPLREALQRLSEEEFAAAAKAATDTHDELLNDAIRVVREHQHASVSLLQRRLKIGYSRAARLMDQLEEMGIVGQADGSKQRPVLDEPAPFTP